MNVFMVLLTKLLKYLKSVHVYEIVTIIIIITCLLFTAHNATAHISRIYSEAQCNIPRPKIIPIETEIASKTYVPHCTVLHRCADDTGCCHTDAQTCVPKRTATVDLYFYVSNPVMFFLFCYFKTTNIWREKVIL